VRKTASHLVRLGSVMILLGACSCKQKESVDYSAMHAYQPAEIRKIVDNAVKIENVGEPSIQKTEIRNDGSTIVTTHQIYRVVVETSNDHHLVPKTEATASARGAGSGPIIIVSSCEMTCTPVRPGDTCNISGCMPTDKCGCTQGSCGNNCTTDNMCHQGMAAFGFGGAIMF
jgi:hypothetical protein